METEQQAAPDVEILVHATAPSRAADDETYRRLARATLAFRSDSLINICGSRLEGEEVDASSSASLGASQSNQDGQVPSTGSAPQPFLIDSQDLSFEGAWDNRSSPRLKDGRITAGAASPSVKAEAASQNSWQQPPSQIDDSYPLPSQNPLFVSPTRTLQQYIRQSSLHEVLSRGRVHSGQSSQADRPLGDGRIDVPSSLPVPSRQDCSQDKDVKIVPVTPAVSLGKRRRDVTEVLEGDSIIDVTHISSSDDSLPSQPVMVLARAESAPTLARPQDPATPSAILTATSSHLIRSVSDTRAATYNEPFTSSIATSPPLQTLEIRPPSPPPGIGDLDARSLVTPKLSSLVASLSSRYRPDPAASRPVEDLERGYWLADCSAWSCALRDEAWGFLAKYLGRNHAGWGVWCCRDTAHDNIRLYCWGCLAEHAYLLLYLASDRKLKLTGAVWVDADGEVAVRVLPHSKKE